MFLHIPEKKWNNWFIKVEQLTDGWIVKNVKHYYTGFSECLDTFNDDIDLSHVNSEKCFWQIISLI